jgi:hypothetical protein
LVRKPAKSVQSTNRSKVFGVKTAPRVADNRLLTATRRPPRQAAQPIEHRVNPSEIRKPVLDTPKTHFGWSQSIPLLPQIPGCQPDQVTACYAPDVAVRRFDSSFCEEVNIRLYDRGEFSGV